MRQLIRLLSRRPGASVAAILMSAIGIALLTCALALVDATLWRPPPFPGARDALILYTSYTSERETRSRVNWSWPRLEYVRNTATTLDLATPWRPATVTLTGSQDPHLVSGEFVSLEYFPLLGVTPVAGRAFAPAEVLAGRPQPVAMVSESFRSRLTMAGGKADPGSTLRLNGHLVTIIGVLPRWFRGLTNNADLWLPIPLAPVLTYPEFLTTDQDFIVFLARAKRGYAADDVRAEIAALAAAANRETSSQDASPQVAVGATVVPLGEARVRPEGRRAALLALAGSAVLFLLTIANLIALQVGQAVARRRETAVAFAIGASPARIWKGHAAHSVAPVAAGAVLALAGLVLWLTLTGPLDPLAATGRGFFATFSEVPAGSRIVVGWFVATLVAVGTVAIVAASWAIRHTTLDHLREGSHGSAATGIALRRPGITAWILVTESALAVVLVAAAGQLLESYRRQKSADVGVDPRNVMTFELQPSESAVPTNLAASFIDRVLGAVREVPGVLSASVDGGAPLAGSATTGLHVAGRPDDPRTGPPLVLRHYVGPDHFRTLGIPLRRGRSFTDADDQSAPRVVVISETAARRFFPAGDAIGQRVWFEGSTLTSPDSSGEIIGIVGDVKYDPLLGERTTASFYTPYRQFTYGWRVYFVRTSSDPIAMQRAVAASVGRVAPELPLLRVRTLSDVLTSSIAAPRRVAGSTAGLAVLGLLLAVFGIWAIVSHATNQRVREIAIRMAHGATSRRVLRLVVTEGLLWPLVGLGLGLALSLAASRVLQSLLYGIAPGDPVVIATAAGMFLLSGLMACLLPAWRAARIDPIISLRSD